MAENMRAVGREGEDAAHDYLVALGYQILHRNYRFRRYGEIDIIAKTGGTICFVEVKSRTGIGYGTPAEAVGYHKQRKILTVAYHFLKNSRYSDHKLRIDIIEVYFANARMPGEGRTVKEIRHIENAFGE